MRSNYLEWFHRPVWQQFLWQQLVIILLLMSFYFFIWQENQHKIHAFQRHITEQQNNATQSQQRIKELPSLFDIQQKIRQITAELGQNNYIHSRDVYSRDISPKGIPSKNEPSHKATVLKRLHLPLIHSGSQLMEWKSYKENNQIFWHIVLSLNYDQLLHFLSEIQQLQPPLLIKHLTINPIDGNLIVRIVLSDMTLSDLEPPDMNLPNKIQPASVNGNGEKS
ncbi:hypothetical protein [Xenorhabdus koppenhoeferi]|uniref:Pilus assembly protein HofO n=1 Tax=Xenorhabdus koppenhoeferi TaxID=351659 RepID=A0A1I7JCI0_9GAMM|nr:hypothetical protein [Xenorhabdus koppenhoeferi]SFU82896.1 pilus assembly protein HofO [Xenorhabdus koppenhoeferi]